MEIVGLALPVLILILVGVFLPFTINRQKESADAHSEDRFSSGIRLLDTSTSPEVSESRNSTSLVLGAKMQTEPIQDRKTPKQLAAIRAAKRIRNYNVARRHAAAQRRLTLIIVEFAIGMVVATMGAVSMISLWWTVLPAVLMLVTLGLGAVAARKGRINDALDLARIKELETGKLEEASSQKNHPRTAGENNKALSVKIDARTKVEPKDEANWTQIEKKMTPAEQRFAAQKLKEKEAAAQLENAPRSGLQLPKKPDLGAVDNQKENQDPTSESSKLGKEEPAKPHRRRKADTAALLLAKIADQEAEESLQKTAPESTESKPVVKLNLIKEQADQGEDKTVDSETSDAVVVLETSTDSLETVTEDRAWRPMAMPVPVYNLKPMIQRRDIDTKALLEEQINAQAKQGRVPYRPLKATVPFKESLSTQQLVQLGGPVDVEQILDNRRVANS